VRVLVVDDSAERAAEVGELLRAAGHEVAAAPGSPVALLKSIGDLAPDIVVLSRAHIEAIVELVAEAERKLDDRKLIERAKGMLMRSRGLDEERAYKLLRKLAMDRQLKLGEVAQKLVDAADLLGA
jgi:two-component system, response regulator / RNA-binding antiterminator